MTLTVLPLADGPVSPFSDQGWVGGLVTVLAAGVVYVLNKLESRRRKNRPDAVSITKTTEYYDRQNQWLRSVVNLQDSELNEALLLIPIEIRPPRKNWPKPPEAPAPETGDPT